MLGLGKIFGSKKSEYFLEFGEGKGTETPKTEAKPAPAPAPAPAPKDIPQAAVAKPEAPKPATVTTQPEVKPEPKPEPPKEPAPLNSGVVKTPPGMTFAPNYLMPQPTGSRRRPGQNMAMFKEMARQMQR